MASENISDEFFSIIQNGNIDGREIREFEHEVIDEEYVASLYALRWAIKRFVRAPTLEARQPIIDARTACSDSFATKIRQIAAPLRQPDERAEAVLNETYYSELLTTVMLDDVIPAMSVEPDNLETIRGKLYAQSQKTPSPNTDGIVRAAATVYDVSLHETVQKTENAAISDYLRHSSRQRRLRAFGRNILDATEIVGTGGAMLAIWFTSGLRY